MKKNSPGIIVFHSHGVGQLISVPALPSEGETIWSTSWEIGTDGAKGSNVAVALGRLGISTAFIGKVGTDIWSQIGLEWLEKANVDYSHLIKDPSMKTQIGLVMVDYTGRNTIVLGGDAATFTMDEIRLGIDAYPNTKYLVTGFEMDVNSTYSIIHYAKLQGKYIILNPSPVPSVPIHDLTEVDLLILNHHECCKMIEMKGQKPDKSRIKQIMQLHKYYGCRNIILTMGEHGSYLFENHRVTQIPPRKVTPVDTSGAGDSFLAAVTAGLYYGCTLTDSCRLASAYSSLTVQKSGTFSAFESRSKLVTIFPEARLLLQFPPDIVF